MLSRFFRKPKGPTADAPRHAPEPAPVDVGVDMRWRPGTRFPIPDWEAMGAAAAEADKSFLDRYYATAARQWLDALGNALPDAEYRLRASGNFLLLSSLPERAGTLVLGMCEQALRAIRARLGPLASDEGHGPYVVMVFASRESYHDYLDHYRPTDGDYAPSSGVFINAGYGHFASWHDALDDLEPVVVHELSHALLTHLPLPVWLNEGIAVNVEQALLPRMADPRLRLYSPAEMHARHLAWWNAGRIQAFWSGEAFHVGDGEELAYDLAATITRLAAKQDESAFRAFVLAAGWQDAGRGAEAELGFPLVHLVEAVLGEGDWAPRPAQWRQPESSAD
ncbi:hypothetical protein FZO89_12410 [Luteimonas viscosa]|uniref:DUF1570 domain-containing protein n=1 Tax=Luteimonas viscosa TaxID=1132694 RepID=A0A5D4XQP4_9GAMM|nr:hypothetical protein [Luteimonas viscosa]TYT26997.1 hypothetical protein FZO89_12410 [Luteimonas viscosa]